MHTSERSTEIRYTTLVSELVMNTRFSNLVGLTMMTVESAFYSSLTLKAGKRVSARELVLIMVFALGERKSSESVSLRDHVEAMLGDDEGAKSVLEEFLGSMENVAKRMEMKSLRKSAT